MPVSVKIAERYYVTDIEVEVDPNTLKDAPLAPAEKQQVEEAIAEGEMLKIKQTVRHTEDVLYQLPVEIGTAVEEPEALGGDPQKPCTSFKIIVKKLIDPEALAAALETATGLKLAAAAPGDAVNGFVNTIKTLDGYSIVEVHCYDFTEGPNNEHGTTMEPKAGFTKVLFETVLLAQPEK